MLSIKLTQEKFALVDDSDFEWLNQWKWHISTHGYAMRRNKGKLIYMHRLINNTLDGYETDHVNRNKLDNRRENLISVNKIINGRNRGENKNNTSGHKGISWDKRVKKWEIYIWNSYKKIHLGHSDNINDAFNIRKAAERIYWI